MAVSFLTPKRTILLISDDALYIYVSSSHGVNLKDVVSWDIEDFEDNVSKIISQDCKGRSVLILNDMVEQHYRKERVISSGVSVFDRASMLKRKIRAAFPNYPIRAFYPLKEKLPKTAGKFAAKLYIFAALPEASQFLSTVGAVRKSLAPISDLHLLPVESADLVKKLGHKISKNKKRQSDWIVFMGQHKSGGLRQIVTKRGELALTRMTPIIDVDKDPNSWAKEAYQELQATMSYLSRFGYHEAEGLDVLMVGDSAACDILEAHIGDTCQFTSMTAHEAANHLGIPFSQGSDGRYADAIHVGWVAQKTKFTLPMNAPRLERVSKPRKVSKLASILFLLCAAYFSYEAFEKIKAINLTKSNISDNRAVLSQLNVQLEKEIKRKEALGLDIRLVQSSLAIVERYDEKRIDLLGMFSAIGDALGRELRINKFNVEREEEQIVRRGGYVDQNQDKPQKLFEATLQMRYPSTSNIDKGNAEVTDLGRRLAKNLPQYKIEVTKLLKDYEYIEQIVVESGDIDTRGTQQDFVAEIVITGAVPND